MKSVSHEQDADYISIYLIRLQINVLLKTWLNESYLNDAYRRICKIYINKNKIKTY